MSYMEILYIYNVYIYMGVYIYILKNVKELFIAITFGKETVSWS